MTVFLIIHAERASQQKRLVIEDPQRRRRIITNIHDSSHLGTNRMQDMVAEKYYWPGLTKDVKDYVS